MKILDIFKNDKDKRVIEALKKKDLDRRDAEIKVMKQLNRKLGKGDIQIVIHRVHTLLKEI